MNFKNDIIIAEKTNISERILLGFNSKYASHMFSANLLHIHLERFPDLWQIIEKTSVHIPLKTFVKIFE